MQNVRYSLKVMTKVEINLIFKAQGQPPHFRRCFSSGASLWVFILKGKI